MVYDLPRVLPIESKKVLSEVFIKGTPTVKNNFVDHVKKSQTHSTAVLRLVEAEKVSSASASSSSSSAAVRSGVPKQSFLMPYLQKISARQMLQLANKFQLAHFLTGKNDFQVLSGYGVI